MKHQINRLVIAAYRLPYSFKRTVNGIEAVQNSGGLVSAILALSEKLNLSKNDKKIAWVGVSDESSGCHKFKNEHFDLFPVKIDQKLNEFYYSGFCNDLIWPLFHYFPSRSIFKDTYYHAYKEANKKFCRELLKIIEPGDFVWIHDYQLMLVPDMVRKKIPDATIGFFLHIPFPSFEIFRLIPRNWREKIINGLLGADMLGFHTHDYAQHFIKSVKRTTGFECRQNFIYTPERMVKADAFPIGIDFDKFNRSTLNENVLKEKQKIGEHLKDKKLIFSVDRLDYSKGLLLRLKGYETFLEMHSKWHKNVVFNMVVVPSRDNIDLYKEMKKEIEYTVGRINGKYSSLDWRPIIYQYKSLAFENLVALYDTSDVGLITPLRDGMNLVAKEYVACQVQNVGVLILSEMAGAAAELTEALIINPVDDIEMAEAIFRALEMKPNEKLSRIKRMQQRISTYNVFTWTFDFFNQTFEIKEAQKKMSIKFLNKNITNEIVADYKKAKRRIFFLDYDGTLVSFAKYPELAIIDKHTLELINTLVNDPKNKVVIISGRDKEFLEAQFKQLNVDLVAEHGFYSKKAGRDWESSLNNNSQWKESILPILLDYVNRCNGTFIEEKTGSIAWHYRNADADFAQLRLHELRDDLSEIIRHKTEFEIIEGNKVLEIKSGRYDKGVAADAFLNNAHFDFVFAAGDDKTDEDLFRHLPNIAHTIRVGSCPSLAKYNVTDFSILLKLLHYFVN